MDAALKRELLDKDRKRVWHPFTQMKDYAEQDHLLIEKAEGLYLYDADGNRYYDTVSSWWVNVHGHGHPRIKQAIARQLEETDHIMFSGFTHRPGIELADKLIGIVPPGLGKVFYSDNGSTAVEVALKMSFQYWRHVGRPEKAKFAFLEHSYHGDTLGAVSVGGVDLFHATFRPLLFDAHRVPSPDVRDWADGRPTAEAAEASVAAAIEAVRRLFEASADEIAGIIVEPMIQAAGSMRMHPAAYLAQLRELCTRYDVHLIADEIAVGFGRTGTMFACEQAGVTPDLLCLSKGLTAGMMPLAATLCTDKIYEAFYDDYETLKTFFHGHSFTGNPLACAVALESLRIFEDERVMDRVRTTSEALRARLPRFGEFSRHIANVRQLGLVAAFDLYEDAPSRRAYPFTERRGFKLYLEALREGLILRPLGDTIYYWLPHCTTVEQLDDIVERTCRVLERLGYR
ncbi:adenosylmethionine--8-amino-7-oxononanoate transaminase [Paenibacillus flagellatus]|uniref:Adenosylmethionine-8-amino-7-oxononanoate aminotransferase n=1 Tax=Paenibacillus flagellatus TaxID=2211139 RepID=A0A2V5JZQ0_9BACL|nr:adenosylmethionine--8-amino-7-oxononanoate transaminase [Paenibacillus flagellatus]PYI50703.1 adenosylmethionine--8-amino-7-oxononanoate transaminase [Paenibacillus flagellatus]